MPTLRGAREHTSALLSALSRGLTGDAEMLLRREKQEPAIRLRSFRNSPNSAATPATGSTPPILGRAAVRAFAGGRLPSVPSKRFGRDTVSMRCANLSHVVLIDGVAPHVRERPRSTAGGRRHRGRSAPSAAVWPTAPALLLLCVQPDVNLANAGAAGPVGGACVLHRQGRGAAVAASVGVIPGVPLQNSWSRRSRRSRLLRLGDCERLRNCRLC